LTWRARLLQGALVQLEEPLVGGDEEAAGTASRVTDLEVRLAARVRLHDVTDGLDERPRREVLARAFLAFDGGALQEALKGRALDVHIHGGPFFLIDHADDAAQVHGVGEAGYGLREDVSQQAGRFAKLPESMSIVTTMDGWGRLRNSRMRCRGRSTRPVIFWTNESTDRELLGFDDGNDTAARATERVVCRAVGGLELFNAQFSSSARAWPGTVGDDAPTGGREFAVDDGLAGVPFGASWRRARHAEPTYLVYVK